ncbi:MAG: sigma 54-interacting transcriptional regulator [Phycisphaerae bacterium]|jgi:formate hydrogenlyase transcriptional activator
MQNMPDGLRDALLLDALALRGLDDTRRLVETVRRSLREVPGLAVGGIGVHNAEREAFERIWFRLDAPDGPLAAVTLRADESELPLIGEQAVAYVSDDLDESCPPPLADIARLRVRRYLAVPMCFADRIVGCLFAGWGAPVRPPHDVVDYLELLASLAAPVLWNCLTQERLRRGDRRRDVLIAFGAAINASLEFDAVITAARKAVDSLADDAGCSIDLLDADGRTVHVYRAGGPLRPPFAPAVDPLALPLEGSPLSWVREHRKTHESGDLSRERRFRLDGELCAAGVRRYVVAPMIVRGDVIGSLFMGSTSPHPPLRMDVWLYENIALQTGLAIENARQFLQLHKSSERLAQQNVYLREEIRLEHDAGEMVGRSPAMLKLRQTIARVAPTDSTVLIYGQTGVGKELVARAIHEASARGEQPMVKVNCAAIPEGMVESELFGHERGAFTSAVDRRIGRFELSNEGTLFLDEVGELSLTVQSKLLRVLQDGEFERVGGTKTIRTNVRIIAATNRDLPAMVESGAFRSDLYYRLAVFPIHVPPLCDRPEDIPVLIEAFVAHFNRRMGKRVERIDPVSQERLMMRRWPGNIRELRHVIERAMILCEGPMLALADDTEPQPPLVLTPSAPPRTITSLDAAQAAHIRQALLATGGRIQGPNGAAALLGLRPSTLRSRMRKLGVKRYA